MPRGAARRALSPAKTATDTVRVRYNIRRSNVEMSSLDAAQQRRFGEMLAENDPAAARAIRRLDHEEIDALTRVMMDARTRNDFARASAEGDVDSDELSTALKRYDELDADERATANKLVTRVS